MKTILATAIALTLIATALFITRPVTASASPAATITAPTLAQVATTPTDTGPTADTLLFKILTWYGIACLAFNSLAALISTIVKQTPGTRDDEAVDKLYASSPYKAIAWVFSWGDYLAEFIAKLKT